MIRSIMLLLVPGSSPLARGLLVWMRRVRVLGRIIPARAGFTPHHQQQTAYRADHPRSRGVYAACLYLRGQARRIIPARAGFTPEDEKRAATGADHPRSRGVY